MSRCFSGCSKLSSVNLENLETVGDNGFYYTFTNCTNLGEISFGSLNEIGVRGFYYAFVRSNVTSISFPALTSSSFGTNNNQFDYMLQGVTGCTVHFPENLESVIGGWSSVSTGFSGSGTTVLFDLPATT